MKPYLLGIDAGSTTIKLALLSPEGEVLHTSYTKHALNIKDTVVSELHSLCFIEGDKQVSVAVTGSAGMMLSEILGLPHIQEVVATRKAVRTLYPEADVVVELGGEDAKIVYLSGGTEQRMNSSCAGGTGAFLDLLSGTIGVRRGRFSAKSYSAMTTYPIASRCAVFAQTDVRALLNQGARRDDIILSVYKAIVTQTIAGLACGRPIEGTVVYLGGPFYYSPVLAEVYRRELGLTRAQTIVPKEPHTFVARGAALYAEGKRSYLLSELEDMVRGADADFDESVEYLSPLLEEGISRDDFIAAHKDCIAPRARLDSLEAIGLTKSPGLFLGIDAGSTTVKVVLIDETGNILASEYERHRGEFLEVTCKLLRKVIGTLPDGRFDTTPFSIARCVVTGYGEHALKVAFKADKGVVETSAHLRASQQLVGNVDSILDIGGQDIKYMHISDGAVDDVVINEACSSGCGALIESFSKQFRCNRYTFARDGIEAVHPVELGTRCTVFMTSRVRHAQKEGVSRADISAGLAYSVVRNALYKVIGFSNLDKLGDRIMVQGGCFQSEAVLAAFERITGKHALRPDISGLMGAYGCALIARDEYLAQPDMETSTLLDTKALDAFAYTQKPTVCQGCTNACHLTICTFTDDGDEKRRLITGNRCEKPVSGQVEAAAHPNLFRMEQDLLDGYRAGYSDCEGKPTLGLTCARELLETLPFWTTFAHRAGFNVVVSEFSSTDQYRRGIAAIPSEGACYPSKLIFGQIDEITERGADACFLPQIDAGFKEQHDADTSCPVAAHYVDVVLNNPLKAQIPLVAPDLIGLNVDRDRSAILEHLEAAFSGYGLDRGQVEEAFDAAVEAQRSFEKTLHDAADEALVYMRENGVEGALMACHSYHVDPGLSHGIDTLLCGLDFVVFSPLSLSHLLPASVHENAAAHSWHQPARLYDMCEFVAGRDDMELVHLYSFGCGVDSMAIDTASDILRRNGKLYTGLKIDEMVDLATIRIRLRSLRAAIDRKAGGASVPMTTAKREEEPLEPIPSEMNLIVPGVAPLHMLEVSRALEPFGYRITRLSEFSATSADTGLRFCNNDLCYSTVSLVGNVIEHLDEIGSTEDACILVPQTCTGCRSLENEVLLKDSLGLTSGRRIPILGFPSNRSCFELSSEESRAVHDAFELADTRLREDLATRAEHVGNTLPIGVIGNFNLLFTPTMNNDVFDLVISEGGIPIFPAANDILATNKPLMDLSDELYEQGVRDIIYLQAFGCLTGNIYGSGAAKAIKKKHPDLMLTFIDYDPGVSQTNQVNRIKLAMAVAHERRGESSTR